MVAINKWRTQKVEKINMKKSNSLSPFLDPPDHLRQFINHDETQFSREISHLSTQITQLYPRLIL